MNGNLTMHVKRLLVVGGGIGGPAIAIRMAERGVAVDLVDIEKEWGAAGTGVTLSPPTSRALCDLGFAEMLIKHGHLHDTLTMYDPTGNVIDVVRHPRLFSPDVPAGGGIMRPVLHEIMEARMRALGVSIRTGTTVSTLEQGTDEVEVSFTDGTTGTYDLVIGADGLFSKVRTMIFPDAPAPSYTGQICWRAQFRLPDEWHGSRMYFTGPLKLGFSPCARHGMYMYLLENAKEKPRYEQADLLPRLRELLQPAGGEPGEIRDSMDENTAIIARPLESIMLDDPWYAGRIILIGDAAHATTPHLASGAGLAIEDAIVLVDELEKADDLQAALGSFMARRLPRGRLVVGNSLRLGEMEQNGSPPEEMAELFMASSQAINEPY